MPQGPRGGRMNNEAMKEVLNELFSHLERLETQNEAILQFLKEKKRVTDKQLAPYLEQAGNASSVRWRAARVRIDHLLQPEHPEEEIKLGKRPELHEDPSSLTSEEKRNASADKEDKRVEPVDEENQTGPGDQKQIESSDGKAQRAKSESELNQATKEQPPQDNRKQKSDSVHHPTEVTEPLARQEGAEPAAQLSAKEKDSEKEAA